MSPEFSFPTVTYGISNLLLTCAACAGLVWLDCASLPASPLYLRLSQTRPAKSIGRRYRRYFGVSRRNALRWTVDVSIQPPRKLHQRSDSDRPPMALGRSRQIIH